MPIEPDPTDPRPHITAADPESFDALVRRAHAEVPPAPILADSVAGVAGALLAAIPPGTWRFEPHGGMEYLFIHFHPQMHPLSIIAVCDPAFQWEHIRPMIEWAPTFARALVEMQARALDAELRIGRIRDLGRAACVALANAQAAVERPETDPDTVREIRAAQRSAEDTQATLALAIVDLLDPAPAPILRAEDLYRELRAAKAKAALVDRYHAAKRALAEASAAREAAWTGEEPWSDYTKAWNVENEAKRNLADAQAALLAPPPEAP